MLRHRLYRLQIALFALRRFLPAPIRQYLKPFYRRWWRHVSQKRIAAEVSQADPGLAAGQTSSAAYALVCFPIIDWELRFQRPQQLLSRFARAGHPVFYLRTDFQPGRTLGPLEVLAPNVSGVRLPGPADLNIYKSAPAPAQVDIWRQALEALPATVQLAEVVCLVHLPFWAPLAFAARERWGWKIVYDCLDDHSDLAADVPAMRALEDALISQSDLVLTAGQVLYDQMKAQARRCLQLPNAADFEHFHTSPPRRQPAAGHAKRPVIGYYGALAYWFEADWVCRAAQAHPDWQFVLIGLNSDIDLRCLERLDNVHLLGEQPYGLLPGHLHSWDILMIPFRLNRLTYAANPVKFYEYLSSGKPIVATDLPELRPYRGLYYPAQTAEAFVRQLEVAVAEQDPERSNGRIGVARENTWEDRVRPLADEIRQLFGLVSIVIASYRNLEYLQLCLESIWSKTAYPNYEVIVVDNGSPAEVVGYLSACQSRHANLRVVCNGSNLGFARATNIGLAETQASDFVILLNNDTVVTASWMSGLVRPLARDRSLGMVGPVTNWASNEARVNLPYSTLAQMDAVVEEYTRKHAGPVREVKTLNLFCAALRREVVDQIGLLDEEYGKGMFEDDDYAFRLRQAGYRLAYTKEVFVHHWGWASLGQLDQADYDRLFEANRQRFEEKWGEPWQRPPLRLF